jgi:hypothetical protein
MKDGRHQARSKWICPILQKEGMEMDHSKMEGMKRK